MSLRLNAGRATAGVRRLVARHRWMRWIPVVLCSTGLVASVRATTVDADATREAWGERRTVWVARRDIAPGAKVDAHLVELPLAAVPDAAIESRDVPTGRVARHWIDAGEVVTTSDLGGDGELSLLPDGWLAVAVTESPASGAATGDLVDVVSEGVVLVEGAIVLGPVDRAILLGAPDDVAPLIALANDTGVALLRTGAAGPPIG